MLLDYSYTLTVLHLKIRDLVHLLYDFYLIFAREKVNFYLQNVLFALFETEGGLIMSKDILSDYSYGDEFTQFTFFKMPRQLIVSPQFKQLSTAAKLLYSMLLDRMSLSAKNGWHDGAGRVYIYYTVKEVCENIACGRNKAMRLLAELDTNKGIGLIERIRQGQGKPDKIFVKRITVQEDTEKQTKTELGPTAPISEVDFSDVQRSENPTSRSRENRPLEVSKTDPNKTDKNQTNSNQPDLSIYPPKPPEGTGIDGYEQREKKLLGFLYGQWDAAARLLCCPISLWTSCTQNRPPGNRTQDSAAHGAVPASMSFVKHKRPLVGGHCPLKPPDLQKYVSP